MCVCVCVSIPVKVKDCLEIKKGWLMAQACKNSTRSAGTVRIVMHHAAPFTFILPLPGHEGWRDGMVSFTKVLDAAFVVQQNAVALAWLA